MNGQKTKNLIFSLILIPVAIILLFPYIKTFLLSIKDYKLPLGIFGSESIGLEYYEDFFSSIYSNRLILNSIAISSVALIVGAIYTFFASSAITATKNPALRFFLTFVPSIKNQIRALEVRIWFFIENPPSVEINCIKRYLQNKLNLI